MPTAVETVNHTPSSAVSGPSSSISSSSGSTSRRALRQTLNDALTIAGNAVQLDTEGDFTRSMEAYQRSVDLLEQGIQMMRLQRDVRAERPGRDTSHEIAQLEAIREKYKARIALHKKERSRKTAKEASGQEPEPHHHTVSSPSVRRPRTPQSTSTAIPPPQPPPSAPLPPLPPTPDSGNSVNSVLYIPRPRGASLPSNQDNDQHLQFQYQTQPQPQSQHRIPAHSKVQPQAQSQRYEPVNAVTPPPAKAASIFPSGNELAGQNVPNLPPLTLKLPKTPPLQTPTSASSISNASSGASTGTRTMHLDGFPVPKKRSKSSGRPQTAPGPSSASSPPTELPPFLGPSPTATSTRSRTVSVVSPSNVHTPPKRSNSSTALSALMSSTLVTPVTPSPLPIPSRLISPITTGYVNGRGFHLHGSSQAYAPMQSPSNNLLSPSSLSPSTLSKRTDLIPLQKLQSKSETPIFASIYGLMPVSRVAASAPPPAPSDPLRHPYHLLKLVLGTLRPSSVSLGQHSALSPTGTRAQGLGGGFLTPRLYVPSIIWYQPELWTLIMDLPEKARQLEVLREALRTVHETSIVLFGRVMFSAGTQGGPMNLSASGTKISRTRSREQSQHGHSSSVHSINSSPAAAPLGFDDPIAWLNALEKLSNSLAEMQTSSSKKLGLGDPNAASKKTTETGAGYSTINGNSNSVTKKMMDWSTRVAKKAVGGGKGPSGELMDWYSDALGGVCALSAMLDGHLCALKNALPASMATTPGVGTQPTNTSSRRPTTSKGSGYETIGFGRMVSSSSLSSSQTAISSSSSNLTASSSASTLFNIPHPLPNLNNPLPPLPPLEQQGKSDVDYFSSPYAPASQSKPTLNRTNVDPLDEVVSQLVSKYTSFPKFVNTQALMHLEKITRVFATFVCPLVLRDVAVLIQGLRTRTTADGGEWMGATL